MKRPVYLLSSFVAACLVLACSPTGSPPLEDYLARLQRSLDAEISPAGARLPPLPRPRDLRIEPPSGTIDLLDMLSLRQCELNITIGKSNSSLGKLAAPSQRLLLELEFLALAPACIDSLDPEEDPELINTLELALVDKRQQLPGRIWNATLGGPEFRSFWQRPRTLGDYPAGTGHAVPSAIARLTRLARDWLAGEYRSGHDELESLLDRVRRGDGGALLAALELQQRGLAGASPALRQRLDSPLCFNGTPSPQGQIVNTVVRKFFVGQVQPWSVLLDRRRRELLEPLVALESLLDSAVPQAYDRWRARRDNLLASSVDAPRRHARALAELLETCGLRPGAANSP